MTNESRLAHPFSLSELIDVSNLHIGLPMWFMSGWRGQLLGKKTTTADALPEYSRVFSTVEGNTTFYGLPTEQRLNAWLSMASEGFRFCFKLPREISHAQNLLRAAAKAVELDIFLQRLDGRLGVLMIQLPASFSPSRIRELAELIDYLRARTSAAIAVEVRHPDFFRKDDNERMLLRLLADHGADRVIFDSRGLMADDSTDDAVLEAQGKKPKLPVHPIATAGNPVVRFIGHSDWQKNEKYLLQWQQKIVQWCKEGKQCWFFVHTASNQDAPEFARWIMDIWGTKQKSWPGQVDPDPVNDLFSGL